MTRRTQKRGKLSLVLILVVTAVTVGLVAWVWNHQGTDRKDEVQISPQPTSLESVGQIPRSVKVEFVPVFLTDEQSWYKWMTEQVLKDPQRWVNKPYLELSDNDKAIFLSLVLTESSFVQFDETGTTIDSGIDCDGLAQLCDNPAVCDPDLRWNPMENVYCGARYFKSLVDKWNGDYAMAVAEYKGALNQLPSGETTPNPDHTAVRSVFANVTLR